MSKDQTSTAWDAKTIGKLRVIPKENRCVLPFIDSKGRRLEISMPFELLIDVGNGLKRAGLAAMKHTEQVNTPRSSDHLQQVSLANPRKVDVEAFVFEPPALVGLIFDRSTRLEMAYALSPDTAEHVGERMIQAAQRCRDANRPTH